MTFEECYREYRAPLLRWLSFKCRGQIAAEDVLQQTFLKLCDRWPVCPQPTNLKAWLHGFAYNVFRSMVARESHRPESRAISYDVDKDHRDNPPSQEWGIHLTDVGKVIGTLGPAQQATLHAVMCGETATEIASRTGRSLSATTMALTLGRKRLRERLTGEIESLKG